MIDSVRGVEGQTFSPYSSAVGGFGTPASHTIVGGKITLAGTDTFRFVTVDTEGGAATDDLTNISGGEEGDVLILQAANSARTVVLKPGASLRMNADFSLDSIRDKAAFICISAGVWDHWGRRTNA